MKRRLRFKQTTTLLERLAHYAALYRHNAEEESGDARDALMAKASQCEAAAELEEVLGAGQQKRSQ